MLGPPALTLQPPQDCSVFQTAGSEAQAPESWPHGSSPSVRAPGRPRSTWGGRGRQVGHRWGSSGGVGGRQSGWGRRDRARGLLVSWGQRLQESSWQEKETKNNPERESPERGTGKWGAEGPLERGNSDAFLMAQAPLHLGPTQHRTHTVSPPSTRHTRYSTPPPPHAHTQHTHSRNTASNTLLT